VPSRSIAVQTTVATPASLQRSSAASVVSSEDARQPAELAQWCLAERGGADDDASHARTDERLGVGGGADAAAELHRHGRGRVHDRRRELERHAAVPCGCERHDVDERRRALRRPPHQLERAAGVDLDAVEVAAQEPHRLPVEDVDGGDYCKVTCQRVTMLTR